MSKILIPTQERARRRNWAKCRIIGMHLPDSDVSTNEEIEKIRKIKSLVMELLDSWDKNTEELGFEIKSFKCSACGRRQNKQYIHKGENFCKKHYKEYSSYPLTEEECLKT